MKINKSVYVDNSGKLFETIGKTDYCFGRFNNLLCWQKPMIMRHELSYYSQYVNECVGCDLNQAGYCDLYNIETNYNDSEGGFICRDR